MARVSPRAASLVLVLLVLVAAGLRFAGARAFSVPWITPDEPVYALLGRSLWSEGTLAVLGQPAPYYSFLYPALVGLPLLVDDLRRAVELAQALQALVVCLVALPVFAWGRRFLSPAAALLAGALALTLPGLAYAGLLMSETLAYPVVAAALWALARALARPGLLPLGLAAAAVTAAAAVRMQALVLLPAFATAVLLDAALGGGRRTLRAFAPALAVLGLAALAGGATLLLAGDASLTGLLGAYGAVGERGYDAADVLRELAWHAGGLALLTLGAPLVATLLLLRRHDDAELRAFVAVTVAYCAWLVVQVAVFASRYVDHLAERYLVTAAPPLLLGLVAWVARGAPRDRLAGAACALGVVGLVALLPPEAVVHHLALHDTFTTAALVTPLQGTPWQARLAVVALVAAGVATTLLPRRALLAAPVAVGAGLAALSVGTYRAVADESEAAHHRSFGGADPAWIDASASGPAVLVTTDAVTSTTTWRTLFWNRSLVAVLRLTDEPIPGPAPQARVRPRPDGLLVSANGPAAAPFAVTPATVTVRGEQIDGTPPTPGQPGLRLWRTDGDGIRLSLQALGLLPNGDFTRPVRVHAYACGGGRLSLVLLGKSGKPVEIRVFGLPYVTVAPPPDGVWQGTVPAPPFAGPGDVCPFVLSPQGLTGSTRIAYERP